MVTTMRVLRQAKFPISVHLLFLLLYFFLSLPLTCGSCPVQPINHGHMQYKKAFFSGARHDTSGYLTCDDGFILSTASPGGVFLNYCQRDGRWSYTWPSCVAIKPATTLHLNGTSPNRGVLQVYEQGAWLPVCDAAIDWESAQVACRSLGYQYLCQMRSVWPPRTTHYQYATFSPQCTGTEDRLGDCSFQSNPSFASCKDVSITCGNASNLEITTGVDDILRIRCSSQDEWGTFCGASTTWKYPECKVACQQIGSQECVFVGKASLDAGVGIVFDSSSHCMGEENSILDCTLYPKAQNSSCHGNEYLSIICGAECDPLLASEWTDSNSCKQCTCIDGHWKCTDKCGAPSQEPGSDNWHDFCLSSPCQHGGTCVTHPASSHCNCQLSWGGPTCETNIDCPPPTAILNGQFLVHGQLSVYSYPNYVPGSYVEYRCNSDYELHGKDLRYCQDGQWDGETPSCELPVYDGCYLPNQVDHAMMSSTGIDMVDGKLAPGTVIFYSCNAGYELRGTAMRECSSGGNWTGESPTCVPSTNHNVYCADPGKPLHGEYCCQEVFFAGVTLDYYCHQGYLMVGSEVRTCLMNGSWSGVQPVCFKAITDLPNTHPDNPDSVVVMFLVTISMVVMGSLIIVILIFSRQCKSRQSRRRRALPSRRAPPGYPYFNSETASFLGMGPFDDMNVPLPSYEGPFDDMNVPLPSYEEATCSPTFSPPSFETSVGVAPPLQIVNTSYEEPVQISFPQSHRPRRMRRLAQRRSRLPGYMRFYSEDVDPDNVQEQHREEEALTPPSYSDGNMGPDSPEMTENNLEAPADGNSFNNDLEMVDAEEIPLSPPSHQTVTTPDGTNSASLEEDGRGNSGEDVTVSSDEVADAAINCTLECPSNEVH